MGGIAEDLPTQCDYNVFGRENLNIRDTRTHTRTSDKLAKRVKAVACERTRVNALFCGNVSLSEACMLGNKYRYSTSTQYIHANGVSSRFKIILRATVYHAKATKFESSTSSELEF